jgi:hypothetical protein
MSFAYPIYKSNECLFFELWQIDDGSWGFYGYSPELIKMSSESTKYSNLSIYQSSSSKLFKITYNDYEGVYNYDDYPMIGVFSMSVIGKYILCKVIREMDLIENNNEHILFKYNEIYIRWFNI